MTIKPYIILDGEGRRWLRPGLSHIQQRMLGLDYHTLFEMAERGDELTIPDDVWLDITTREVKWEFYHDGHTTRCRVSW